MARTRALTAGIIAGLAIAHRAAAQQVFQAAAGPTVRPSVAATVIVGRQTIWLADVGLERDAGLYTRFGLVAGIGGTGAGGGRAVGEIDAIGRFLLDPLRQSARGVYATGGLALRVEHAARPRTLILAGFGIEGRPLGRVMPAIEASVGGGARVSIVLRPVRPGRR